MVSLFTAELKHAIRVVGSPFLNAHCRSGFIVGKETLTSILTWPQSDVYNGGSINWWGEKSSTMHGAAFRSHCIVSLTFVYNKPDLKKD